MRRPSRREAKLPASAADRAGGFGGFEVDARSLPGDRARLPAHRARLAAVKQHRLLGFGGAEEWVAPIGVLRDGRIVDGHQADRLAQVRVRPWLADQFVTEYAPIERLMLHAHSASR